tara:strand:- start:44 stop:835 length:792 start_codon:yes stop_codon:yes gene_type:complete
MNSIINSLVKFPFFNRLVPSISIRLLKLLKKNRGYFKVGDNKMFLDFLDPIDRQLILYQKYEYEEILILKELIKKHQANFFFDIGSNCGYYSLKLANIFKNLKIFAFDPNAEANYKFKKTLNIYPTLSERITLHNFGLSDVNSVFKMRTKIKYGYAQTGGSALHNNENHKDTKTFDANFKIADEIFSITNSVLAIKIDVENLEYRTLNGLKKIINNNECILQIEIFGNNFNKVNKFLVENKFYKINEIKKRSNYFYTNIKKSQ